MLTALVLAFLLTAFFGLLFIPFLRRLKLGQPIRGDGPRNHLSKSGTPTMGGAFFLPAIALAALVAGPVTREMVVMVVVTLAYGSIGLADDFIKVIGRRSLGLRARQKLLAQMVIAVLLAVFAVVAQGRGTVITFPWLGYQLDLGWLYYPFAIVLLSGFSNAVNLTDGLDGLAAGIVAVVGLAYIFIGKSIGSPTIPVFAAALVGGCMGFLLYNMKPARVFMGDTGSLALGAAIGAMAILSGTELILVIVGGMLVVEVFSVILQVISFQLTGRRIFRMSPLHHHFELAGWSEKRVVFSFWLTAIIFAALGLFSLGNFGG